MRLTAKCIIKIQKSIHAIRLSMTAIDSTEVVVDPSHGRFTRAANEKEEQEA